MQNMKKKNKYDSYLNLYKFFLHFELLASNNIKNQTGKKLKNLLGINLINKVFIQIPGTHKKHLGHTCTPTAVQNNCIKLSGFGVGITRPFLHREITINISCPRKVLQLRKFFRKFLGPTSHTFSIRCFFQAK